MNEALSFGEKVCAKIETKEYENNKITMHKVAVGPKVVYHLIS